MFHCELTQDNHEINCNSVFESIDSPIYYILYTFDHDFMLKVQELWINMSKSFVITRPFFLSIFIWSHRVLRHTVFICASRSLSVQASACRSSVSPHHGLDDKGSSGTLVFIDVENINTVRCTACFTPPVGKVIQYAILFFCCQV